MADILNINNKSVCWVEKLTVPDILFFLIHSCFADIKVNYDQNQVRPSARKFLRLLEKLRIGDCFCAVKLSLHGVDREGFALFYKVNNDIEGCIEDFFARHISRESKRFKDMLKSYLAGYIIGKFTFIAMVDHEIYSKKLPEGQGNLIHLSRSPFNHLIRNYYSDREFTVSMPFLSLSGLTFYLRPFFYLAGVLLCKIFSFKVRNNITDIKPAVWVEYSPGYLHSFWVDHIKSGDFDIVYYIDRPDTPTTKEITDEIEGRGLKWVDAHPLSVLKMGRLRWSVIMEMFKKLFHVYLSKPVWLGIFRYEHYYLSVAYEAIFSRHKVKVLLQHQEALWKQESQALAIERSGGIMVGYHWSVYAFCLVPAHFFPQHVYFVWGKYMGELLSKKGSACRYVLPSGIWIVPGDKGHQAGDLFSDNVNFIITVFDDSVSYNVFQSPGSLADFYLRILSIAENNPRFGCIIKSKNPLDRVLMSIPSGKEIKKRAEALRIQKRLTILDSSVSPVVAATHSDLSVGYSVNSACTISAIICGSAAICWDCAGFRKHPFYKHSDQKLVFSTLDELEEAILKFSRGDKTIGDYSRWKKCINHFEDVAGINRIAGFLTDYMKENMSTGKPEHSLDFAVKKYLNENKVGDDFYEHEDIWNSEIFTECQAGMNVK